MEYKIFFDRRVFIISDNEEQCFNAINGMGVKTDLSEMKSLVDYFEQSEQVPELWFYSPKPTKAFAQFVKLYKLIAAAGGLVRNASNDFLLIYRHQHWDLPKGKLEKKESTSDAALREVREECGLPEQSDLSITRYLIDTYHVYTYHEKRILKQTSWYEMNYRGSEILVPQAQEQIEKAEWVTKMALSKLFDTMYVSMKEVFIATGVLPDPV